MEIRPVGDAAALAHRQGILSQLEAELEVHQLAVRQFHALAQRESSSQDEALLEKVLARNVQVLHVLFAEVDSLLGIEEAHIAAPYPTPQWVS